MEPVCCRCVARCARALFFDYDSLCNLVRGDYSLHDRIFRTPDKVGNLYREPECRGRRYDRGGRLLWDGEYHYSCDCEGNLVRKSRREHHSSENPDERKLRTLLRMKNGVTDGDISGSSIPRKVEMDFVEWEPGDTCYEWQSNGMLAGVRTADGRRVTFGYDALGRRVSKRIGDTVRRFGWDGNVLLHEWEIPVAELPRLVVSDDGSETYDRPETYRGLVTWVYDGESFTPVAKVTEKDRYTIVQDYLGTPTQAYDSEGRLVWEMLLDVYGRVMESRGDRSLVPFRYQGQYEDEDTGLYYNRFRYYSPEMGMYISSDPIGLAGNNPTLYGYVEDVNTWLDPWGLSGRGGTLHQSIQNQIKRELIKIYGEDKVTIEGEIQLGNGHSRYGDVVVYSDELGPNGKSKILQVHQVGDMRTRGGFRPSSRERGAIMDIRQSDDLTENAKIIFHDKYGRITLINPDQQPDWKAPSNKHRKIKCG